MRQIMRNTVKRKLAVLVVYAFVAGVLSMGNPFTSKIVFGAEASGGYGLNNPVTDGNGVTTWDCVWFGNYWQEDTNGDEKVNKNDVKQSIKWRVLSVEGDDAFLLADKNLDCWKYNDTYTVVNWENSTIRSWLNGYGAEMNKEGKDYSDNSFFNNAFLADEQSAIKTIDVVNNDNPEYGTEGGNDTMDKVYLMSREEVTNLKYGFSSPVTMRSVNTSYTVCVSKERDEGSYETEAFGWWLRTPGISSSYVSVVFNNGYISSDGVNVHFNFCGAVRPALHLNLSSTSNWSYAGTVNSKGEQSEMISAKKKTTSVGKIPSFKLKQKNYTVTISWNRVSRATGYQICYSTSKKWKNKKLKLTRKNKLTIKKLKKNKTYYFRVRAYQMKATSKVYGSWSKTKKITIKK